MPRLSKLRIDPSEVTSGRAPSSGGLQGTIPSVDQPADLQRSPVMIASLPGLGSGPDAVLRQFNGGRDVPKRRILVP